MWMWMYKRIMGRMVVASHAKKPSANKKMENLRTISSSLPCKASVHLLRIQWYWLGCMDTNELMLLLLLSHLILFEYTASTNRFRRFVTKIAFTQLEGLPVLEDYWQQMVILDVNLVDFSRTMEFSANKCRFSTSCLPILGDLPIVWTHPNGRKLVGWVDGLRKNKKKKRNTKNWIKKTTDQNANSHAVWHLNG